MKKIAAHVNHKLELFVAHWENWVNYVPSTPAFNFANLCLYDEEHITLW